jgi:hypothetical protein
MADLEHRQVLDRGVAAWNAWRKDNPHIRPVLRGLLLTHPFVYDMGHGSRELMDWVSGDDEERKRAYKAWQDGSLWYDSEWEYCWAKRDLGEINLESADLSNAELILADFSGANFKDADLRGANLQRSILKDANLRNANLERALLGGTTFANTDLTNTMGLLTCRHSGGSRIDAATIHRSGRLPQDFLLACGLSPLSIRIAEISTPDLPVAQVNEIAKDILKLVEQPTRRALCFISYSSQDEEFARKLYDDLLENGVLCWFAPHDIRGGRKLDEQIDDAIRHSDRVLLVLSESSMNSNWVNTEIANARNREVRENRRLLYPIRIVSFEAIKNWKSFDGDIGKDSAREIREYFIPDFSNWRDRLAYDKTFRRLLDDLIAE